MRKGYNTAEKLAAVGDAEKEKDKKEALKSSAGTYLEYLFLMMTDKRYKPAKEFLHQASLANNQQYLCDALAMKRFMANFIGTATGKPKQPQQ